MKKQIGIEYEGYIFESNRYGDVEDIITTKTNNEAYKQIYGRRGTSLYDILHTKLEWINQHEFRDNYIRLAELRFFPINLEDGPQQFVNNLLFIKENLIKNVKWSENERPSNQPEHALRELDNKISLENLILGNMQDNKNFIGEVLSYNFKQPLTIVSDKVLPWISDNTCRNRGGGLHINISPVKIEDIVPFITKLHEKLFPLNYTKDTKDIKFKSNYRQQLIFRYRDYNGIPGVEYMSIGLNLDELNKEQTLEFFSKIFKTVNELL